MSYELIEIDPYATVGNVQTILSNAGVSLRVDDDQDGQANAQEALRIPYALVFASERVNLYLWNKYDPSVLGTSNLVNQWTAYLAACTLCMARGNPVPTSLQKMCEQAEKDMEKINLGKMQLPGIPMRRWKAPVWDNQRGVPFYRFRVLRTEIGTSSQQPNSQPVQIDITQAYTPY